MLPNVVASRSLPPRSRPSLIPRRMTRYSLSSFSSLPPLPSANASALSKSRIPQARPSQTGPQVKPSLTVDHSGCAVPAATQRSTPDRSPKPVLKSILKKSTSKMIARRPTSVCAEPISLEGEGLCKASPEVYAAPWRSFPAREWENDKLPIEGLDRCASHRQQIEKRKLLAGGAPPRTVQFAQKRRWRIVSRWIEDPE